jgi:hypothetical protein
MLSRILFSSWGLLTGSLFRVGMWLVRLSNHRLCHSFDAQGSRWHVEHWTSDDCPLRAEDRDRYAADLKVFLWALAEPSAHGHAGDVPLAQYMLLKELVANIWTGGRTVAVVALIDEVMAAEDLVIA